MKVLWVVIDIAHTVGPKIWILGPYHTYPLCHKRGPYTFSFPPSGFARSARSRRDASERSIECQQIITHLRAESDGTEFGWRKARLARNVRLNRPGFSGDSVS